MFREHACRKFIESRVKINAADANPEMVLRERMKDALAAAVEAGYSPAEVESAAWIVARQQAATLKPKETKPQA
jgi:uncharacterized Ntn-hydrolase superfamily protein